MIRRGGGRKLALSEDLVRAIVSAVDDDLHGTSTDTICNRLEESPQRLGDALEFIKEKGILLGFGGLWFHPERYEEAADRFLSALEDAHRLDGTKGAVPLRAIVSFAELNWTNKATARVARDLIASGRLKGDEEGVRLPSFQPKIGVKQEITLARLVEVLNKAEFKPPVGPALAVAINLPTQAMREILRIGEFTDRLIPMENGIWTTPEVLDRAYSALAEGSTEGCVTIATARTILDASRRFAHAFLLRLADDGRAASEDGEWKIL